MDVLQSLRKLDAPEADPPPPAELWARGLRWRRRRNFGTAFIATTSVLLLLALTSWSWQRPQVGPATMNGDRVTLPYRLESPADFTRSGVPGERLVAIASAQRLSASNSRPLPSALTGSGVYLTLQLPDDSRAGYALSPDGRHLAYWVQGAPSREPNTRINEILSGLKGSVTGIRILDLVSGDSRPCEFNTAHGLIPDAILWADSSTLVVGFAQTQAGDGNPAKSSSGGDRFFAWRVPQSGAPSRVRFGSSGYLGGTFAVADDEHVLLPMWKGSRLVNLATGEFRDLRMLSTGIGVGAPHSSGALRGDQFASVHKAPTTQMLPGYVELATIQPDTPNTNQHRLAGGDDVFQILGWRDSRTLVIVRRNGTRATGSEIATLDVQTGRHRHLIDLAGGPTEWQFARDLLDSPVAKRPARPTWHDSQFLVGGAAVSVLAGVAMLAWRRRVQA